MICSHVYTALITPFDPKGDIDKEGFCQLIRRQKAAHVSGLVVLGSTGESATLTSQEKESLIKLARKETDLPLMVGCGSYSTAQTIENLQMAASCGADSALVISPFYNKPTQEGLFCHFEALAKASPIPIVVYNHPGRTGVNIEIETLKRIAHLPRIWGVKESCGNISQICDILSSIKRERPEFSVISGDDDMTFSLMALGGDGVISSASNLIPEQMVELTHALKKGDFEKARELHFRLVPLFKALALETNPIPLKAAMQLAKLPSGNPRLPLTPLNSKFLPTLNQLLKNLSFSYA